MEITVNNQTYTLATPCTIASMLSAVLHISAGGMAIAVNQSIVSKSNWASYVLEAGDQVMLIKATQGG